MLALVKSGLRPAWRIALGGIVIGGLAGFYGLVSADGTLAVAQACATAYALVAVVPPLILFVFINQLIPILKDIPVKFPNALILTMTATWVGVLGASFLFWVVSTFGAGLLGGEDTVALRALLLDLLLPMRVGMVLLVDTALAVGLALWFVQANENSRR